MSEIYILIFLITTLGGLIYSFGRKRGKEKIENKINKDYIKKVIRTKKKRDELNKENDDSLIASYIRLLNKSKPR
jgi:hypothetical protein